MKKIHTMAFLVLFCNLFASNEVNSTENSMKVIAKVKNDLETIGLSLGQNISGGEWEITTDGCFTCNEEWTECDTQTWLPMTVRVEGNSIFGDACWDSAIYPPEGDILTCEPSTPDCCEIYTLEGTISGDSVQFTVTADQSFYGWHNGELVITVDDYDLYEFEGTLSDDTITGTYESLTSMDVWDIAGIYEGSTCIGSGTFAVNNDPESFEIIDAKMVSCTDLAIGIKVFYSENCVDNRIVQFNAVINDIPIEKTFDITAYTTPGEWVEIGIENGSVSPNTPLKINIKDEGVNGRWTEIGNYELVGEISCNDIIQDNFFVGPISYGEYMINIPPADNVLVEQKFFDISADSGERLELWWKRNPSYALIPHYELWYFLDPQFSTGVRVGQCHFPEGCNSARFVAPDSNRNNKPDFFTFISWRSLDYGYDDYNHGVFDAIIHITDICAKKYSRVEVRLPYRSGCNPPVSMSPNICDPVPGCNPPYEGVLIDENLLDPSLGPESESLYDELLAELVGTGVLPEEIVMGESSVPICDVDWDGICNATDYKTANNSIDTCWGETGYNISAESDGDGCITESDIKLLFDVDNDGVLAYEDNCPNKSNYSQKNSDTDSHGDVCDNCPYVNNEDQADSNGNGIGDACDPDTPSSTTTTTTISISTTTTTIDDESSTTTTSTTASTTTSIKGICSSEELYGKYSKETTLLRQFRDEVLNQTPEGQELIRLYYKWSPAIVKAMERDEEFKEDLKKVIDGVLELIQKETE